MRLSDRLNRFPLRRAKTLTIVLTLLIILFLTTISIGALITQLVILGGTGTVNYPPPPPPPTHTSNVGSSPVSGVYFTLDGTSHVTPFSAILDEGSHTVVMPSMTTIGGTTYNFFNWEDGSTDPTRTIDLTADMTITANYEAAPPPPPPGPVPEPGTPYKWLGARTTWNAFRMDNDADYRLIVDSIHPSYIQYQMPGEWWEIVDGEEQYQKWERAKQWGENLMNWAHEDGIYVDILWGNMFRTDIGLGPTFQQHIDDFLSSLTHKPLWFGLDIEWTYPYGGEDDLDVERIRSELEAIKTICNKYGVRFILVYARDWDWSRPFWNDYPMWWGTNFPVPPYDTVDMIDELDDFQYGFGMKIGVVVDYAYESWTAENIRLIFDHCDQTQNIGVIGLDLYPNMFDEGLCPDFVSTVNAEAQARGYVTS